MATVLQVKSETYTVYDIDDVLEIIHDNMGDDTYNYVLDYINELKQEVDSILLEADEYKEYVSSVANIVNNIQLP